MHRSPENLRKKADEGWKQFLDGLEAGNAEQMNAGIYTMAESTCYAKRIK